MKNKKLFILWILVLSVLLIAGAALLCMGIGNYLNGTMLPHHSKNLAQSVKLLLC